MANRNLLSNIQQNTGDLKRLISSGFKEFNVMILNKFNGFQKEFENQQKEIEAMKKGLKDAEERSSKDLKNQKETNALLEKRITELEKRLKTEEEKGNSQPIEIRSVNTRLDEKKILDDIAARKDIPGEIFVVVRGFDGLSKSPDALILSPYFYSHLNGYKVLLMVYPGGWGDGSGTHLSLFIRICEGEYDDDLPWPCKYIFSLSMVDQLRTGVTHNTMTLSHDTTPDNCKYCYDKPITRYNDAHGYGQYMSHSDLRSTEEVLVDDRIIIKCTATPPSQ